MGLVCSTTECGLAVAATDGTEAYVSKPMPGAVCWHGYPAFDLDVLPGTVLELLKRLSDDGWDLSEPGYFSQSWRQHDMVLVDRDGAPLMPALSWQCNGAHKEAAQLNRLGEFHSSVGAIEPRFIAAKLPWALAQEPSIERRIDAVMTSGDWFAGLLTSDQFRLSTSDALSNGLLHQQTKQVAIAPMEQANKLLGGRFRPEWFPPVIPSHGVIGTVDPTGPPVWKDLCRRLRGWKVVASLGDNHASAAGCGAAEYDTIVLSLGTGGTINLPSPHDAKPAGKILGFEYWDDRLFLLMLAECAAWYDRRRLELAPRATYEELNHMALRADLNQLVRIFPGTADQEVDSDLEARIASTQCSIAIEMLDRVRLMLDVATEPIRTFVLTGGLSRAPLIRETLYAGLRIIGRTDNRVTDDAQILLNNRSGQLSYKTDALGALINTQIAAEEVSPRRVIMADRSWRSCDTPTLEREKRLTDVLESFGWVE